MLFSCETPHSSPLTKVVLGIGLREGAGIILSSRTQVLGRRRVFSYPRAAEQEHIQCSG